MSQPQRATLNATQQQHLALAEADSAALDAFIAATHAPDVAITADQWLAGAALAAGLAEQLSVVAELADTDADARLWHFAAGRVRDTAVRFELWAELAEVDDRAARDAA